jgi:C4-dicarboxylate transporter, DctM subunit
MSGPTTGLIAIAIMIALMFVRVPIGLAMFMTGAVGIAYFVGPTPIIANLAGLVYDNFSKYSLSVIPIFLLMGAFASRAGLSGALFRAGQAFLGHRRGGLAMATIGACAGFGAICGSSVATAATMAQVALPEMKRAGYHPRLTTGTLAAGGTLGILIPPSIVLVIYAILAEQNIAKLFVAAFIPGVIAALGYCIAIAVTVRIDPSLSAPVERASPRCAAGRPRSLAGAADLRAGDRRHVYRLVHTDGGRVGRRRRHRTARDHARRHAARRLSRGDL